MFLRKETLICGVKHVSETRSHEQIGWINASVMVAHNFDKAMPTIERLDLRKVLDLTLDPYLTPSFKTFNIALSHSVKVFLTVECAGKQFPIFGNYARCTLLAKDYGPELPDYIMPLKVLDETNVVMIEAPLPSYQQVMQESQPGVSHHQGPSWHRRRHRQRIFSGDGGAGSSAGAAAASFGGGGGC